MFVLKIDLKTGYRSKDEVIARDVDDVVGILRSDYRNAYFVTGI